MTKVNLKDIPSAASSKLAILGRYKVIIFIVFVVAIYGYVIVRINEATNVQPSQAASSPAQVAPHIDPDVVKQLQQLQDNSVSVKALFNQARTNPFQ